MNNPKDPTLPPLVARVGKNAYATVAGARYLAEMVVQELIDNAVDFPVSASRVWIEIAGNGITRIIDNGAGADLRRRAAMISLFDSPDAGKAGKKGQYGTGLKAVFLFFNRLRVFTKLADEPYIWEFSFSPAEAHASLTNGTTLPDYKRHPVTPKISFFLDPETGRTKASGTILVLEEPLKGRRLNPDRLIERLGERLLLPSVIRRVSVNGQPVKRDKGAEPFCGTPEDGVVLRSGARLYCEFGIVPHSAPTSHRRMKSIGARGHICTWDQMVDNAPDIAKQVSRFPEEFGNPSLWFQVDCDAWTAHSGENSRDHLKPGFYADPSVDEVLAYIEENFGRIIREKVRGTNDEPQTNYGEITNEVMDVLRRCLGEGPRIVKPTVVPLWRIAPTRVRMICGGTTGFSIIEKEADPSATYEWTDIDAGGAIEPKTGTRVRFTARSLPGGFSVEVTRRKPGEEPQKRQAYLTLTEHAGLAIVPEECVIESGETREFTLANTDDLSGAFRWDDTQAGGTVTVRKNGREATYVAGDIAGTYRLVVEDTAGQIGADGKNAAGHLARAAASIVIGRRPEPPVNPPTGPKTVTIEGCQFRVSVQALRPEQFAVYSNTAGPKDWNVVINVRHPALAKAEREGQLCERILWLATSEIAAKVTETVEEAGFTLDGYRSWVSRILGRLAGA